MTKWMGFRRLIWGFSCVVAAILSARPEKAEALLLVLGDQHSAYERVPQLVARVDRLQAENPGLPLAVLLNGDTQEYGNIIARRSAGEIDFALYAALARRGPTVVNLGNHEPEFQDFAETVARLRATGAQVVGNVVNRSTGELFAPASLRLPLGAAGEATIVGITTDNLATYRVAVRPTLTLTPAATWAREHFPRLLAGATLPIVLSHAGIAADREAMPFVPEGALFAGAHDHQRFVHPLGRTVYFHSGSWNSHVSLAWLDRDDAGRPRWTVEQIELREDDPVDAAMAAVIAKTRAQHLTPEDEVVVAHVARGLSPADAARVVVAALRGAAEVDAAFIGNTTFGAGLPGGDVTRLEFDACVRFDGPIFVTDVSGARLSELIAAANLTPDTPFAARKGEFSYAAAPVQIEAERTYRLATTDWGARNTARYFGAPALEWREHPRKLRLKEAVLSRLQRDPAAPAR